MQPQYNANGNGQQGGPVGAPVQSEDGTWMGQVVGKLTHPHILTNIDESPHILTNL